MSHDMFIDPFKNFTSYQKLLLAIKDKESPISIHGLDDTNMAHLLYSLNQNTSKQILLITENEIRAKKIFEDLKNFENYKSEIFPNRELVFYDIEAFDSNTLHKRLKVLNRLMNNESIIVIASIDAVLNKILNVKIFNKYKKTIKYGDVINLQEILQSFVCQGYERVKLVEGKGQFSVRGGIIDFFPSFSDNPYRIELFDDEVDSIRTFDIRNQRSIVKVDEVIISPVKEILILDDFREQVLKKLNKDLEQVLQNFKTKDKEKQKIKEKFLKYIDMIKSQLNITNVDMVVPYIPKQNMCSIVEYFNKNSLIILDEPQRIEKRVKDIKDDFIAKYTDIFEKGELLSNHIKIYYDYDDVCKNIKNNVCITTTALLKNSPRYRPKTIFNFVTKTMQSFHNKIDFLLEQLYYYKSKGYKTIIFSGNEQRGKRLEDVLKENGLECLYVNDKYRTIENGQVYIIPGSINGGFEYPTIRFAVISDKEVFGTNKRRTINKVKKNTRKITNFTDLNVGDYVVHETHGIGKYVGIEQLNIQGIKKDYLTVKYQGKDKLYVPIDQMNLIQKYIGFDSDKPKVSKLSSTEWVKTKTKAKKAIEDMAKDLIELYAKREKIKGFAFSKDTLWQRQFEDMFPYQETEAQIRSVDEIKRDMEKSRVMDRLLCGDVGYGKTEVALRAAFKAIMDNKQVAFLVPTTLLAQQHYNTIIERFLKFPIKVAMLSRFRSISQQKKILNDLKDGNIDIIVGTHRLLSKDVKFHDLGFLIVDEEQRFGVKHKEALKKLKESVDVLTLTATPIPRTLHMSLVGIRDMSIIDEPPEERYPVQTYVVEYNEQLIRDAIIKEIARNGQIYFVYNRVNGIHKMASRLKKLVPEARIAVGHGQMNEKELENVMINFLEKQYDVLVCTTIIETGLDIQNVNTIIIYDSDRMGLSQLYQLRGRVGRSNRIAFAYFTYQKDKVLSEVAEKRLKAIKEFTEFGSGFKIAMRDLEIRGAGNLLGMEQHGHIEAIGYDLYVKFLNDTIKKFKGEKEQVVIETAIELNVDGYIPNSYIKDEEIKIEIYKKIAAIENKEDYFDLVEELIDRFGNVPKQVDNLMIISYIKYISSKCFIISIIQMNNYIKLEFDKSQNITPKFIYFLSKEYGRRIYFDLSEKPILKYTPRKQVLNELMDLVEKISSFIIKKNDI